MAFYIGVDHGWPVGHLPFSVSARQVASLLAIKLGLDLASTRTEAARSPKSDKAVEVFIFDCADFVRTWRLVLFFI